MRRLKVPLALAAILALILSSSALFPQTETPVPVSSQVKSTTQLAETSVAVEPVDTKPAQSDTDVEYTEDILEDDPPSGRTLLARPHTTIVDNTDKQTEKPEAPPAKTSKPPAAANAKPGRFALTFDDLKFDMEKTETFDREMLTPKINSYHGGKITIRGYIRPNFKQSGITKFIFVRDNKECCFGPQAAIFDNILVQLKRGSSTNYTVRPVTIEGDFVLKEYRGSDGSVWSLYRMYNAKIK